MQRSPLPVVLMVHQAAELYGSDKVLLLLVEGLLKEGSYWPVVVVPEQGPLIKVLEDIGVEVHIAEVAKISRALFTLRGFMGLPGRILKSMRALTRIVNGRQVAVVHTNTLAVLASAVWARFHRLPHVWHVHEILISPRLVREGFPMLLRLLAGRVMCNSEQTLAWLVSEQPALKSRSTVVFNGLPAPQVPTPEAIARFRQRVGAAPGDVVITLVGRVSRLKGQAVFIEAAGHLLAQGQDQLQGLKFVTLGDAAPGQEGLPGSLRARIAQLGLQAHVVMLPFESDIVTVWQGTDIAVVPSIEPESFGMVAIEAMAASKPVVATQLGGLLDVVAAQETGLLVPPGDASALASAIAALASDPSLRSRMGAAGLQRQKARFSIQRQVIETLKVYRDAQH